MNCISNHRDCRWRRLAWLPTQITTQLQILGIYFGRGCELHLQCELLAMAWSSGGRRQVDSGSLCISPWANPKATQVDRAWLDIGSDQFRTDQDLPIANGGSTWTRPQTDHECSIFINPCFYSLLAMFPMRIPTAIRLNLTSMGLSGQHAQML